MLKVHAFFRMSFQAFFTSAWGITTNFIKYLHMCIIRWLHSSLIVIKLGLYGLPGLQGSHSLSCTYLWSNGFSWFTWFAGFTFFNVDLKNYQFSDLTGLHSLHGLHGLLHYSKYLFCYFCYLFCDLSEFTWFTGFAGFTLFIGDLKYYYN